MEKSSTDQSPDQSTTDIPYLDPILIQSIADILTFKPKSTSREVYDLLVACSTGEGCVGESVVEACLIAEFGYSPEDTMRIKTLSAAQRNAIVAKRKVAKLKAISEDEDDEEEEKDHIKDGCICDECVIKPVKAVEALCDCNRPVQIISNVWLDRYRIYKEDKPENSSSVALLSIMLGTASTIKSFLPNDLPDDIQSEHSASLRAGQRVYALFYSEWWAWMGPPFRQMNPKLNYKPGLEADTFEGADLHIDEHKMIYWDPSLPYSFEAHVQKALQFTCGCWRSNFLWLKFALCHTQDRNTVLMLNAVSYLTSINPFMIQLTTVHHRLLLESLVLSVVTYKMVS